MDNELDNQSPSTYYIPPNYEDAGGVFGGKFSTRNAIEMAIFCGPLAWIEYHVLHFSIQTNICIAMITILPLLALCAFGIGGESLSQRLFAYVRFLRHRRKLTYMGFSDADALQKTKMSFDQILDSIAAEGLLKTLHAMTKAKPAKDDDAYPTEHDKASRVKTKDKRKKKTSEPTENEANMSRREPAQRSAQKSGSHLMNSAMKEILLRKLELGDNDDLL